MNTSDIDVVKAIREVASMIKHISDLVEEQADAMERGDEVPKDEVKAMLKKEMSNFTTRIKEMKKQIKREKRKTQGERLSPRG